MTAAVIRKSASNDMEKDREDSSTEEFDPFLGSSSHSKYETRSRGRRDYLLYCLAILLGLSLGSHVLTYIYVHRASYLDAACVRHTQQNRMLTFSSLSYLAQKYELLTFFF